MLRAFLRLACLMVLWSCSPASSQSVIERLITPGPLSQAHAKLEANCTSCHESFSKTSQNGKCLACHKPIAQDIARAIGFHGRYSAARVGDCKACHTEHKGRGVAIARLNPAGFNHAFTDYPLVGAHARVVCAGCHGKAPKYRGTSTNCADCHGKTDPHRSQLGRNCQGCHGVEGWKQLKPFDHQKTGFTLTGAHANVRCLSCHVAQRWKGLGTSCGACHAKDDAHKGARGPDCATCHNSSDWKSTRFDHSATGFPLIGAHAATGCATCHGPNNAVKKPARTCNGCHVRDDVHKGQNGATCENCHNSRSWQQVSFDHDRLTRFPLRGAHRQTTCKACHSQPARQVKLAVDCASCHAADDVHKGSNGPDCARCHGETGWKIVSFSHDRMTRFPLRGAHAKAQCQSCHIKPANEVKLPMDCASCHRKDDVHAGHVKGDCGDCHAATGWKTDLRFDHGLTAFPLLGKHATAKCADCHADKSFVAKGTSCAQCHADDHHRGTLGQLSSCGTCHNSASWTAWSFDHDRATSFPLTGAHKGLICSGCHVRAGDPGKLSSQCGSCHRRDDVHRGGFGPDCQRCHDTASFKTIRM